MGFKNAEEEDQSQEEEMSKGENFSSLLLNWLSLNTRKRARLA